jgi:NADPH-dependent 2,4-dienoyl-CoA reductase/sulfur reductase-like enzyme
MSDGIVIAGGGLAAQRCAETLRAQGHGGPIRIVCGEPELPYDRPPLSKELLAGTVDDAALAFRSRPWYAEAGVDVIVGDRAVQLRPAGRRLELASGRSLAYDRLLIATGAAPRRLPGAGAFENVHVLRTLADARGLRDALVPGARLAVIGAGFIGQEVAATARARGVQVTLVEALSAPLAPILGAEIGGWFAAMHAAEGVDVRVGAGVAGLRGTSAATAIELADGAAVACDTVVVGIGVAPDTEWLAGSGLPHRGGVPADASGRTAIPGVWAAGDTANPFDPRRGEHRRSEHWEGAVQAGRAAARDMLGLAAAPSPPPSFWSDQYGVRIQYVGDAAGHDAVEIDGDLGARDATVLFLRGGRPAAALLVGRPRALPSVRRELAADLDHDIRSAA